MQKIFSIGEFRVVDVIIEKYTTRFIIFITNRLFKVLVLKLHLMKKKDKD